MIPPLFGKQEVGIWWVQKRFPWYGVPTCIWSLWPNIRFLPSIVAEKNATKNEHICSMCRKINKVGKQEVGIWWVQKRFCTFFVTFFSATIDGRDLIFGHKLHIGTPYRGKRFWTHQIPTSCLPTLLIFLHIDHICSFFVAFFSATIDGRNLIFGHKLHIGTPYRGKRFWIHQIPTSSLSILLIFIHI
jgi:hypothetical protein